MPNTIECPQCNNKGYDLVNKQRIKHPEYGLLDLTKRQCDSCGHRYDVANNGQVEFRYN